MELLTATIASTASGDDLVINRCKKAYHAKPKQQFNYQHVFQQAKMAQTVAINVRKTSSWGRCIIYTFDFAHLDGNDIQTEFRGFSNNLKEHDIPTIKC